MQRFSSLLCTLLAAPAAFAQTVPPGAGDKPDRPTAEQSIAAFAVRPPDEASPFFANRALARQEMQGAARAEVQGAMLPDGNAEFPRTRGTDQSAIATFTGFFTNMFSSVRLGFLKPASAAPQLKIEPDQFSLGDRREVEVTYAVINDTRRMMRLDYPTAQRIEILTRNSGGEVIDRWSDDRAFEAEEGIVIINPGERISYAEKIPTREMKAGDTYSVNAEVVGYPDFTATREVVPAP
jgi:hypothetical protein